MSLRVLEWQVILGGDTNFHRFWDGLKQPPPLEDVKRSHADPVPSMASESEL